jgi:hypothetical protein
MAPSWIISKTRKVVAKLVPDHPAKRYEIEIHCGVSDSEMAEAANGTVRGGRLVHLMNLERSGIEIKTIRCDYRDANGVNRNRLRQWENKDFIPRPDDIFQERLYCIQWITKESIAKRRQETFYTAVIPDDIRRERQVEAIVAENLPQWHAEGLVPDMRIEPAKRPTNRSAHADGHTGITYLVPVNCYLTFFISRMALTLPGFCQVFARSWTMDHDYAVGTAAIPAQARRLWLLLRTRH